MTVISDNVIPGRHGKIFGTDAKLPRDLARISEAVLKVNGVKDALWNTEVFPYELTIYTDVIVSVDEIEKKVMALGFHVIPKHHFPF